MAQAMMPARRREEPGRADRRALRCDAGDLSKTPVRPLVSTQADVLEAVFVRPELPLHLEVQVLAFARILWGDGFTGEERFRDRMHDEPEAMHFVRTVGALLVSHVQVFPVATQEKQGRAMRIGAVGGVMTYPQFRREGHASALMRNAGTHIREGEFDLGILFCDHENEAFYRALGWQSLPPGRVIVEGRAPDDPIMALGEVSALPPVLRLDDGW
jgi:ribosomal protein S18 acetylase RimI-like enzyme